MADANIINETNVEHIKKYFIIIIFYDVQFLLCLSTLQKKKIRTNCQKRVIEKKLYENEFR